MMQSSTPLQAGASEIGQTPRDKLALAIVSLSSNKPNLAHSNAGSKHRRTLDEARHRAREDEAGELINALVTDVKITVADIDAATRKADAEYELALEPAMQSTASSKKLGLS